MSFELNASGGISQSAVDKATVDSYVRANDGVTTYGALLGFAGGSLVSTALGLASTVKHPIPLYLALAVEVALVVAFGLVLRREARDRNRARQRLDNDTASLNFLITPTGGTIISGVPPSGLNPPAPSDEGSPTS